MNEPLNQNDDVEIQREFGISCAESHPGLSESVRHATVPVVDVIFGIVAQVPRSNDLGVSPHFVAIAGKIKEERQ